MTGAGLSVRSFELLLEVDEGPLVSIFPGVFDPELPDVLA